MLLDDRDSGSRRHVPLHSCMLLDGRDSGSRRHVLLHSYCWMAMTGSGPQRACESAGRKVSSSKIDMWTKEGRRMLNSNKTVAHDNVTHGATARKILNKINGLATQIELTRTILMPRPCKLLRNYTIHFLLCSY